MIGMSFVLTMHLEENANMEKVCESMKVARKRWREAKEGEAQARAVPAEQPFSVMAIRVCSCLSQPGPRIGDYCRLGRDQQPDHGSRMINQANRREVDSSWASSPGGVEDGDRLQARGVRACVRACKLRW